MDDDSSVDSFTLAELELRAKENAMQVQMGGQDTGEDDDFDELSKAFMEVDADAPEEVATQIDDKLENVEESSEEQLDEDDEEEDMNEDDESEEDEDRQAAGKADEMEDKEDLKSNDETDEKGASDKKKPTDEDPKAGTMKEKSRVECADGVGGPCASLVATGAAETAALSSALVLAAKDKANSVTNKRAYDRFIKKVSARKNMKFGLSGPFLDDKLEMFNTWLEAGEDFAKCALIYERKKIQRDRSRQKLVAKKRREIEKAYPGKMHIAKKIIEEAQAKGNWIPDPAAPNDEEERLYWVLDEISYTKDQLLEDVLGVTGSAALDDSSGLMGGDDNIFTVGIETAGCEDLHSAFASGHASGKPQPKPKPKAKPKEAEEVSGEDDPMEEAQAAVNKIIDESSEARGLKVKCQQLDFSDQICQRLQAHADFMEKAYEGLQKLLLKDKCEDRKRYAKVLEIIKACS